MSGIFVFAGGIAAGYALCVFTWTKLRQLALGVESEIASFKAKATELEAKLRFGKSRG